MAYELGSIFGNVKMKVAWLLMSLAAYLLASSPCSEADEFKVSPDFDTRQLAKRLRAGDVVVFEAGVWRDVEIHFDSLPGTVDKPIVLRAKKSGETIFTGKSKFSFSGTHVIVNGFVFRDILGPSDVLQTRTHSKRHGHQCRVTNCQFLQSAGSPKGDEVRWLSVYGTQNRIDHCAFQGKRSKGTSLVVWVEDQPNRHRIDHNFFGPRPRLGENGGETIRVGTSKVSENESHTIVEDNLFVECDGEAEIISNKSSGNIYRHNWFDRCGGALTLRHGHRCVVDSNVFMGGGKSGTGGVRIIGSEHRVTNNYFESLRGDAERAAISMMNGIPNSPLSGYARVRDALVAHNTLIDCKVSFELGIQGSSKQSEDPVDCKFVNNLIASGKWEIFRIRNAPVNSSWTGNRQQTTRKGQEFWQASPGTQAKFSRGSDGLLHPSASEDLILDAKQIEIAALSETLIRDIDGAPRTGTITCGCDVAGGSSYQWPANLKIDFSLND